MIRIFAAAITALLLTLPAFAQTPTPNAARLGPDERAKQWLVLVDDGNYAESTRQMGTQARKADIAALPALRSPLGAMSSRNLKDIVLARTQPGMPAGQYAVVRFDSNFAHRANTMETVTLAMDKAGWSVIGYRID